MCISCHGTIRAIQILCPLQATPENFAAHSCLMNNIDYLLRHWLQLQEQAKFCQVDFFRHRKQK